MTLRKELIFVPNENQCHASTIISFASGDFLAAWFEGSSEGADDVCIKLARRQKDIWSKPVCVAKISDEPHWNPVLFCLSDSVTALYFKVGREIKNWRTFVMHSSDEGTSWSEPHELVPGDLSGGRGPVKNKPIKLASGVIAAPASDERDWSSFVDLSSDGGKTWERSKKMPMPDIDVVCRTGHNKLGVIQPTLWESSPDTVHMLLRSNNHAIYRSDSSDGGYSWCEIYPSGLPNNNSGIDAVKLPDDRLVLAYNPNNENWGPRNRLELLISSDNGYTWDSKYELDQCTAALPTGYWPELSYPAIITTRSGGMAISYTSLRKSICFVQGKPGDFFPE